MFVQKLFKDKKRIQRPQTALFFFHLRLLASIHYLKITGIYNLLLKSMSKSPIKDYSRLLNNSRTTKKEQNFYRYRTFDSSQKIMDELRMKLELSLKHNAKLLDQNSVLSELVSELRQEVKSLNDQIIHFTQNEQQIKIKLDHERKKLLDEIEIKQNSHDFQLKRLLDEVSTLHKEKNDLEMIKNKEMELFKNQHEKNLVSCVQSLKNTYGNSREIYQTEIQKQKEVIENLEYSLQTEQVQRKLEANRLNELIKSLQGEVKHIKQLNHLEIQELKKGYQGQLLHERRNLQREKQIQITNYKVVVKRLKNDIYDKSQQIQSLVKKMAKNDELNSMELEHLKRQKEALLGDLATAQVHYANQNMLEKAKLKEINEIELKNLIDLNETEISMNKNEINGLKNLIDLKKEEIRRIYEENSALKRSYGAEIQQLNNQNLCLKDKLRDSERESLESLQAFKIKMSQLIDADIKSITNYFQNQINALTITNDDLQQINGNIKQKLYKALNDNDQIRKYFEVELSKQKARVQDLKIKLAAVNLEHKEHITSLGSKMEMTSMTLVREAQQKQRSQNFFEEEKKKFHSLNNSKDKEINDLMETMHRMKKMHEQELNVIRAEKKDLRDLIDAAEDKAVRIKQQFEEEMKRKTQKMLSEQPKDDKIHQEIKELFDKNEKIENDNIKLQKQVEHLARDNRALAQELGLKKGYIETLQLESCAAIEDEKSKLKIMMGNNQVTLKEYFQQKVASREKDNEHLRTVISQKQKDIRELIVKYNGLEKRLEMLLESQERVKDFQEKIKNLGLDTNLVKNMAELFTKGK